MSSLRRSPSATAGRIEAALLGDREEVFARRDAVLGFFRLVDIGEDDLLDDAGFGREVVDLVFLVGRLRVLRR